MIWGESYAGVFVRRWPTSLVDLSSFLGLALATLAPVPTLGRPAPLQLGAYRGFISATSYDGCCTTAASATGMATLRQTTQRHNAC